MPEFNGSSALSLLEATETWKQILSEAGIHELLWGGIILSKLGEEASSRLPSSVKHNRKFNKICNSLEDNFGGVLRTSSNIMRAHLAAGEIPDPHTTSYEICEKILEEHCEITKTRNDSLASALKRIQT